MSTFNFDAVVDPQAIKRKREERQMQARKRRNVIDSNEILRHRSMSREERTAFAQSSSLVYMYGRYFARCNLKSQTGKVMPADLTVGKAWSELAQSRRFRWENVLVDTTYMNSNRVQVSASIRFVNVFDFFKDQCRKREEAKAKTEAFVAGNRVGFNYWVTNQRVQERFAAYVDPNKFDLTPQYWTSLPNIWLWEEKVRNPISPNVEHVIDRVLRFRQLPGRTSQFEELMYLPGLSLDDYEDARNSFCGWTIYGSSNPDPDVARYLASEPGFVDSSRCIFQNVGDVSRARLNNAPDVTDYVSNNLRQVVDSKEYKDSNYPVKLRVPEDNPDNWELMVYNGHGTQISRRMFQAGMTYMANRFDQIQDNQQDMKHQLNAQTRNQHEMKDQIDRMEQMITTLSQTRSGGASSSASVKVTDATSGVMSFVHKANVDDPNPDVRFPGYRCAEFRGEMWVPGKLHCLNRTRFKTISAFNVFVHRGHVRKLTRDTVQKAEWFKLCDTAGCNRKVRTMYSLCDILKRQS